MDIHDKLIRGKLDGRIFQKAPGKGRSACPIHGTSQRNGRGDGFRFFRDAETSGGGVCNTCGKYGDGFALLMAVHGWSFQEALGEVARVLGIEEGRGRNRAPLPPRSRPKAEPKARNDSYIRGLLRRAWMESVPLSDPSAAPALRYLMRRRLSVEPLAELKNFRFHPALDYVDEDGVVVGQFPALLMGVSDALGRAATMHRTYLSHTGEKAAVDEPKKLFPLPNDRALITSIPHPRFQEMMVEAGGYIRMGEPQNGVLGVAEGFETALSIHLATGMTVWPCVSADLLERFVPPEGVEQLVIWGDLDRSGRGRDAAQCTAARK
nr:toprim domain-containing protein [Azospirillum sp. SYSU D00513]